MGNPGITSRTELREIALRSTMWESEVQAARNPVLTRPGSAAAGLNSFPAVAGGSVRSKLSFHWAAIVGRKF